MPEVSIIMPSYNHGAYIGAAIESVIAQSFDDWELLVIDNASQDNSQALVQQFQARDQRIQALFNPRNLQTARAINQGFDQARGRYLMILTSDDIIPPKRLEHQVAAIQTPGNENKVIVGQWVDIDSQGRILNNPCSGPSWQGYELKRHGDIFESLALAAVTYISMQTLLFTREHLTDIRFDERFPLITNEYKFALDLASRFQFHATEEIVFVHRIHGDNQTCHWDSKQEFHEKAVVGRELLGQYGHRLSEAAQKRQLELVLCDALQRQDMAHVRTYFLKQLALDPSLLEQTFEHCRRRPDGPIRFSFPLLEGVRNYTLAQMRITLEDLEAVLSLESN